MIRSAIAKVVEGADLSEKEMSQVMDDMTDGVSVISPRNGWP